MDNIIEEVNLAILDLINEIDAYCDFVLEKIDEEKKRLALKTENDLEGKTAKEREWYLQDYFVGHQLVSETFFEMAINSVVVMLYSTVEWGLTLLANGYTTDGKTGCRFEAPRTGNYLEAVKDYFRDSLTIEFGRNQAWPKIRALGKIRNTILHNTSEIDERKILDDTFIKKQVNSGHLEVIPSGFPFDQIKVTDLFIRDTLQAIKDFFTSMPINTQNKSL